MRTFVACLSLLVAVSLYAETPYERRQRYQGAQAPLQVTVRDDRGEPVKDASVRAYFWNPHRTKSPKLTGLTDENGRIELLGDGYTDTRYFVEKDGYYTSEGHAYLKIPDKDPEHFWERLRWKPVIHDITLKKKRNPIEGFLHIGIELKTPVRNHPVWLDLENFDWLPPYGEGVHRDVAITLQTERVQIGGAEVDRIAKVCFAFPNTYDGAQRCDISSQSYREVGYHVDTTKPFVNPVILEADFTRNHDEFLPYTSYLTFRVRSKCDEDGGLVSAQYGFMYRFSLTEECFTASLLFLNPTPNDTNIEYDPKRSLAKSYADRRWEATQKRLEEERKMLEEMGVENFIRAIRAKRSGASGTPTQEAKGAAE